MENALSAPPSMLTAPTWPDEASLAAFRAWLQGVPTRAAVDRYLPDRRTAGASARSVIGRVKRQLVAFATSRAQAELASTLGLYARIHENFRTVQGNSLRLGSIKRPMA